MIGAKRFDIHHDFGGEFIQQTAYPSFLLSSIYTQLWGQCGETSFKLFAGTISLPFTSTWFSRLYSVYGSAEK